MVAAQFRRCGNAAEVINFAKWPIPEPGPGEVLLRMQAASLHPADRMFIAGTYRIQPQFPQVAGLVGAGLVVQCGAGVDIPLGTLVAFRHPGAWAEFCSVPADRIFVVPSGIDEADASQFALNPVTAWALLDLVGVGRGDWLAVNAARSNVVDIVRSLAKPQGINVVDIPNASTEASGHQIGTLAQTLLSTTANQPIAALLDAVGGPQLKASLPALRQGGVVVSYGLLSADAALIHNADMIYRNLTWHGFGVDDWLSRNAHKRDAMQFELWNAIAGKTLRLPTRGRFALSELRDALQADATAGTGKVILTMGEAA